MNDKVFLSYFIFILFAQIFCIIHILIDSHHMFKIHGYRVKVEIKKLLLALLILILVILVSLGSHINAHRSHASVVAML